MIEENTGYRPEEKRGFECFTKIATDVVGFHCFKNCPCIHPPCADGAPSAFSAVAADIPSAAVSAATAAIPAAPVENDNN
ncbi:unnamed protein product [Lathyrus oleraceus]